MPRPSPVTDAVRRLLETADRHLWSLDELLASVRREIASANFSTIHRALTTLERRGAVSRVDLGDGKARYEIRDDHHEHVRCEQCGRVEEVPGCSLEEAAASVQAATGFRIRAHHLVFAGLCPECARALEARASA